METAGTTRFARMAMCIRTTELLQASRTYGEARQHSYIEKKVYAQRYPKQTRGRNSSSFLSWSWRWSHVQKRSLDILDRDVTVASLLHFCKCILNIANFPVVDRFLSHCGRSKSDRPHNEVAVELLFQFKEKPDSLIYWFTMLNSVFYYPTLTRPAPNLVPPLMAQLHRPI